MGQKGRLIGSLDTRTTSEGDGLARSRGTSLATSRSREAGERGESKKLVGELRDSERSGARIRISVVGVRWVSTTEDISYIRFTKRTTEEND